MKADDKEFFEAWMAGTTRATAIDLVKRGNEAWWVAPAIRAEKAEAERDQLLEAVLVHEHGKYRSHDDANSTLYGIAARIRSSLSTPPPTGGR